MKMKLAALLLSAAAVFGCLDCGAAVPAMFRYDGISARADVRAGAGVSNMYYVDTQTGEAGSFERVPAWSAEAGVTVNFLRGVALSSGLGIVSRGARDASLLDNRYSSTWLRVPFMLTLQAGSRRSVRAYLQGGCYGALGVGGKTLNEVSEYPFFGDDAVARPLDFGLSAGAGAVILDHFLIGVQYERGLVDISAGNIARLSSLSNETLSVSVGYVF